jgi:hypothetical protein
MTPSEIKEHIAELNPDALFADGFDEALIGYVERCGTEAIAVYDEHVCVSILMQRDGMECTEAQEFFDFNVKGSYVGENTPFFFTRLNVDEFGC